MPLVRGFILIALRRNGGGACLPYYLVRISAERSSLLANGHNTIYESKAWLNERVALEERENEWKLMPMAGLKTCWDPGWGPLNWQFLFFLFPLSCNRFQANSDTTEIFLLAEVQHSVHTNVKIYSTLPYSSIYWAIFSMVSSYPL